MKAKFIGIGLRLGRELFGDLFLGMEITKAMRRWKEVNLKGVDDFVDHFWNYFEFLELI